MENMDSSCQYRRESFGTVPTVSPVLLPATPNPAALSSASFLKGAGCSSCVEQPASLCLANDAISDTRAANASCCPALSPDLPASAGILSNDSLSSLALHNSDVKASSMPDTKVSSISDEMRVAIEDPAFWDSDEECQELIDGETHQESIECAQASQVSTVESLEQHGPENKKPVETLLINGAHLSCEGSEHQLKEIEEISVDFEAFKSGLHGRTNASLSGVDVCQLSVGSESDDASVCTSLFEGSSNFKGHACLEGKVKNFAGLKTSLDFDCVRSCSAAESDDDDSIVSGESSKTDDGSDIDSSFESDDEGGEIEFASSDGEDGIEFSSTACEPDPDEEFSEDGSDSDESIQFLTADEIDSDDDFGLGGDTDAYERASPASSGYSSASDGQESAEDAEAEAVRLCVREANRKWNSHYRHVSEECSSAQVIFEPQPKAIVHKPKLDSLPSKSLMKASPEGSLPSNLLSCLQETTVACFTSTVVRTDGGVCVEQYSSSSYSVQLKQVNALELPTSAGQEAKLNSAATYQSALAFSSDAYVNKAEPRGVDEVDYCKRTLCGLEVSLETKRDRKREEQPSRDESQSSMEVLVNLFPTDVQPVGDSHLLALKEKKEEAHDPDAELEPDGACCAVVSSTECRPLQLVMNVDCLDVESCVSQDGVDYEDVCYNGVVESFDVVRSRDGATNLKALLTYELAPLDLLPVSGERQAPELSSDVGEACPEDGPAERPNSGPENSSEQKAVAAPGQRRGRRRPRRVTFNLVVGVRCLRAFMEEHQAARDGRCWMQCAVDRARERRAAGKPETGGDSEEDEAEA